MQAIDNLTRLRGVVLRCSPHPTRDGWHLLTLQVEETEPVAGKADLLEHYRGSQIEVSVRSALLSEGIDCTGARIDLRAKMTPDGALAEAHPDPAHFKLEDLPRR